MNFLRYVEIAEAGAHLRAGFFSLLRLRGGNIALTLDDCKALLAGYADDARDAAQRSDDGVEHASG